MRAKLVLLVHAGLLYNTIPHELNSTSEVVVEAPRHTRNNSTSEVVLEAPRHPRNASAFTPAQKKRDNLELIRNEGCRGTNKILSAAKIEELKALRKLRFAIIYSGQVFGCSAPMLVTRKKT